MEIWDRLGKTELEEGRGELSAQVERGERGGGAGKQRQRLGQREKSKTQYWCDLLEKGEHWGRKERSFHAAVLYV